MLNRILFFQRAPLFKLPTTARALQGPPKSHINLSKDEGNTPLHHAIWQFKDLDQFKSFLDTAGKGAASVMSRTVNDRGELPIDLINNMAFEKNINEKLYSMLIPLMAAHRFLKKLSDRIDSKKLLESYRYSPASKIYKNLQLACSIVNRTREALKKSSTHPEINNWKHEEKFKLNVEICNMRSSILLAHHKGHDEKITELPLKLRIGNCREFSNIALHFLRLQDKNIPVKEHFVEKGDHRFLIIGEGYNAVVCDAWVGEVYPASDIPNRLGNYRQYSADYSKEDSIVNVITSFNKNFHKTRLEVNDGYEDTQENNSSFSI